MRLWNTIEFSHVSLGSVLEILDAIDIVAETEYKQMRYYAVRPFKLCLLAL